MLFRKPPEQRLSLVLEPRLTGAGTEKSYAGAGEKRQCQGRVQSVEIQRVTSLSRPPAKRRTPRDCIPTTGESGKSNKRRSQARLFLFVCCKIEHLRLFDTNTTALDENANGPPERSIRQAGKPGAANVADDAPRELERSLGTLIKADRHRSG